MLCVGRQHYCGVNFIGGRSARKKNVIHASLGIQMQVLVNSHNFSMNFRMVLRRASCKKMDVAIHLGESKLSMAIYMQWAGRCLLISNMYI